MTEIRAEAIERIARSEHEFMNQFRAARRDWDTVSERERQEWRHVAARYVDALGDLLPTIRMSRVHPCDCQPCSECETAALEQGAVRQEAFVTDWKTIEGGQE